MHSLYVFTEVCYVFLKDVHIKDDPYGEDSEFQRARWHTPGYSLPELLVP